MRDRNFLGHTMRSLLLIPALLLALQAQAQSDAVAAAAKACLLYTSPSPRDH
jgi:hypothetical protein